MLWFKAVAKEWPRSDAKPVLAPKLHYIAQSVVGLLCELLRSSSIQPMIRFETIDRNWPTQSVNTNAALPAS
jgi:hypothetical protein